MFFIIYTHRKEIKMRTLIKKISTIFIKIIKEIVKKIQKIAKLFQKIQNNCNKRPGLLRLR